MSRANRLRWSASATTVPGTSPTGPSDRGPPTIEIAPPTIPQGVLSASQIPPPIAPQVPHQVPQAPAANSAATSLTRRVETGALDGNCGRHRAFPADDRGAGEHRAQAQHQYRGTNCGELHERRGSDRHHALRRVHPREWRREMYRGLQVDASARAVSNHGVPGWIRACG